MFENTSMSPADMSAIMGNGSGVGNEFLWLIIIFAVLFGWGGFGGNNSNNTSGAYDNYVLASDFATLERQIDSSTDRLTSIGNQIANGISSLGYDQLAQMNGINQNVQNNGYETRNAITQAQIAQMNDTNALQAQLASCCCANEKATMQTQYNIATESCATRQAINAAKQEILGFLTQDKIDTLTAENQSLRFAQSQTLQNQYLVNALRPSPIPAYTVTNPYYATYGTTIS